jgi:hypothetical protein
MEIMEEKFMGLTSCFCLTGIYSAMFSSNTSVFPQGDPPPLMNTFKKELSLKVPRLPLFLVM